LASCDWCPHRCELKTGQIGICGVRIGTEDGVSSRFYGLITDPWPDPVEKKPLYHFLPGTKTLSFGSFGCNFHCGFCQNFSLADKSVFSPMSLAAYTPSQVVKSCLSMGLPSLAFTYSEPAVWQDFLLDTASEAKAAGLKTIMVSNGFYTPESLERFLPLIDAFNIDLKGDQDFYKNESGGRYEDVLRILEGILQADRHLEVTTLLTPGYVTRQALKILGQELKEIGLQVWHLSRFFPAHHWKDKEPTAASFMRKARGIAGEYVPHVYLGNTGIPEKRICPSCGHQHSASSWAESQGICEACGTGFYGLWKDTPPPLSLLHR
jgi:pyruvate formate lyase activating enzyme